MATAAEIRQRYNRLYPLHYTGTPGASLSPLALRQIFESVGFSPTRALQMMQITKGESSFMPGIVQTDPGNHMIGYGLTQITPNAWGAGSAAHAKLASLGGIAAMRNPVRNAEMAYWLSTHQDPSNPLAPWYGTRYLNRNPAPAHSVLSAGGGTLPPALRPTSHVASATTPDASGVGPDVSSLLGVIQSLTQQGQRSGPQPASFDPGYSKYYGQAGMSPGALSLGSPATTRQTGALGSDIMASLSSLLQAPAASAGSNPVSTPRRPSRATHGASTGLSSILPQGHSQLLELIHNTGSGEGFGVKNGQLVDGPQFYSGVWAGHRDHVHVAAGPTTIVALGKLAQKMGLTVSENPHFGGVHPVHVPGSYHYSGEAIDVGGDPNLMNRYAREVERLFGLAR